MTSDRHTDRVFEGKHPDAVTLFLCGDVMTGRGIDQILPHPGAPAIHESYMKNARGYVELTERTSGPIDSPVEFPYIWGDALAELEHRAPDVRIINLETSVTTSEDVWRGKGINYRMHPRNIPVLQAAEIDISTLANNHVLDWGYAGLSETMDVLGAVEILSAGAGRDIVEARRPAVKALPGRARVIVFSFGVDSSGIPASWAATDKTPGVNLLSGLKDEDLSDIRRQVVRTKRERDVVVASIHWGSNWGHHIPNRQVRFAHRLIDDAGIDIVHGHSSHHVRAIEVYKGKLILYGAGDFINDYEGIGGHEEFRGDLSLMYFATVEPATGRLVELKMTPTQMKRFQVLRAQPSDALWLRDTLNREGKVFGTQVEIDEEGRLSLHWGN